MHRFCCRDGGIGRHEGLKILWPETAVWVQVPLAVPRVNVKRDECPQIYLKGRSFLFAFLLQVLQWDLRRKSLLSSSLPECCVGLTKKVPLAVLRNKYQRVTTQDVGWLSAVRVRSSRTSPAQRVCYRGSLRDAPCRSPRRAPHLRGKCVLYRPGRR